MRTLTFDTAGAPAEVLQVVEKDRPVPAVNEVLVKVLAAPVNPSDIYFIEGTYRTKPQLPGQTAGLEAAGIVETAGADARVSPGTLVAFYHQGTWAEYVRVPVDKLAVLPQDFPLDKAAQFTLNPFTAWGLLDMAAPAPGEWMLLTAGNSAVARIVIQLAAERGVHTIALIRDMDQAHDLYSLGAEHVCRMDAHDLSGQILAITQGKGINVALDTVGGPLLTTIIGNMAPSGRLIIYGRIKEEAAQFTNPEVLSKLLTIRGFGVISYLGGQTKAQRLDMIRQLTSIIGRPSFQLPVMRTFSWRQFKNALELNDHSGRSGKVLLQFS